MEHGAHRSHGVLEDSIDCPGCGHTIDLAGPSGEPVIIDRVPGDDGRAAVTITIGIVTTHRCTRPSDGTWHANPPGFAFPADTQLR